MANVTDADEEMCIRDRTYVEWAEKWRVAINAGKCSAVELPPLFPFPEQYSHKSPRLKSISARKLSDMASVNPYVKLDYV